MNVEVRQTEVQDEGSPGEQKESVSAEGEILGDADGRRVSSTSTNSSLTGITQIEPDKPSIQVNTDPKTANILFSIGTDRPKTIYGRVQADHMTAYATFVQGLLNAIDVQYVREIPDLLRVTAACFLGEDETKNLESDVKELEEKKPYFFDRELRKQYTKELRNRGVDEKHVIPTKIALKVNDSVYLARIIQFWALNILQKSNLRPHATFLNFHRKSASEMGREGSTVRKAIAALKGMNELLSIRREAKSDEEKRTRIDQLLGIKHINDLKELFEAKEEKISIDDTSLLDFIEKISFSGETETFVVDDSVARNLGRLFSNLFDFNYCKRFCTAVLGEKSLEISRNVERLKRKIKKASNLEKERLRKELKPFSDQEEALKGLKRMEPKLVVEALEVFFGGYEAENKQDIDPAIKCLDKLFPGVSDDEFSEARIHMRSKLDDLNEKELLGGGSGLYETSLYLNLARYTAEHFRFVMQAFPELGKLGEESKAVIRNSFYEQVWQTPDWQYYSIKKEVSFDDFIAMEVPAAKISRDGGDAVEGNNNTILSMSR